MIAKEGQKEILLIKVLEITVHLDIMNNKCYTGRVNSFKVRNVHNNFKKIYKVCKYSCANLYKQTLNYKPKEIKLMNSIKLLKIKKVKKSGNSKK